MLVSVDEFRVSIVIPSKGGEYLEHTLKSIAKQNLKPDEVVLVLKDIAATEKVEKIVSKYNLRFILEEQKGGFFTKALNIGKELASGDIIIFTDDDIIAPEDWTKKYVKLFKINSNKIGSISSRDKYYELRTKKLIKTPDDLLYVKVYRRLIRPLLDPPLSILNRYRLGSYISKKFNFVIGKGIPNKECFSLPFRGVNMAFRRDCIEDIFFIEHPELKRGFRNEQHFGIQLILKGYESIYVPYNYVFHIVRESLSRVYSSKEKNRLKEQLKKEEEIVRNEIKKILSVWYERSNSGNS